MKSEGFPAIQIVEFGTVASWVNATEQPAGINGA